MHLSSKPMNRIISASDRSNLPNQNISRPFESQFRLFDNFRFSHTKTANEDKDRFSDPLQSQGQNQFQSFHLKNNWENDILQRISNINLQSEEIKGIAADSSKIIGPKAFFSTPVKEVPYPKCVNHCNSINTQGFQQFVWPEKGYPYPNLPNGFHYVMYNAHFPGRYVIQPQCPLFRTSSVRNIGFGKTQNQHQVNCSAPQIKPPSNGIRQSYYSEKSASSNSQRLESSYYFNQGSQKNESQVPSVHKERYSKKEEPRPEQDEQCQNHGHFRGKNYKSKSNFDKPKPIKKIGLPKYSRHRNYSCSRDPVEERDIACQTNSRVTTQKGRPILSSRK